MVFSAFINGKISRFGCHIMLVSNRGTKFTSDTWSRIGSTLGIHHRVTSAYNLCANGMVKQLHWNIKAALQVKASTTSWITKLPMILLGL